MECEKDWTMFSSLPYSVDGSCQRRNGEDCFQKMANSEQQMDSILLSRDGEVNWSGSKRRHFDKTEQE
jgi:hypothetical protein